LIEDDLEATEPVSDTRERVVGLIDHRILERHVVRVEKGYSRRVYALAPLKYFLDQRNCALARWIGPTELVGGKLH
jgi:hypothetical protein